MGPGPLITVSSIRECNILSAVSWSVKSAFNGERIVADAKLIWHAEVKPFVTDIYAGGVAVQKDLEIRSERHDTSGWTNGTIMRINQLAFLGNRLLHVHGIDTNPKTQVILIGSKREKIGLLEVLPGNDWQDNTARMECPACRDLLPRVRKYPKQRMSLETTSEPQLRKSENM
jgi:hypothetical protein